ncbi:MAG: hypothetical protein WC612_07855 [Bdellovibrionales bacterium]|jgi:hypothetical protein
MKTEGLSFTHMLAPRLIGRVVQSFDKATIVIVASCWGAALLVIVFALYTLNLSVQSKKSVVEASAREPFLPKIVIKAPDASEIGVIIDRMKSRFPDITFTLANDQSLAISAVEGAKFRTWLTVLSYVDTISPQYRWQIKDFCVGMKCPAATPMKATLVAQKITFLMPDSK